MFNFINPFERQLESSGCGQEIAFVHALTFKRVVFLILGLVLLGVATVGVVTPGIPTTGPLLLASYFLTKSCPVLESKLIRNRFFGKYVQYLDGSQAIPQNVRSGAIRAMWISILISCSMSLLLSSHRIILPMAIICSGLGGHFFILRFRTENRNVRSSDSNSTAG